MKKKIVNESSMMSFMSIEKVHGRQLFIVGCLQHQMINYIFRNCFFSDREGIFEADDESKESIRVCSDDGVSFMKFYILG